MIDLSQSLDAVNYWAVLVAALTFAPIGWIWYSILFNKIWMEGTGLTQEVLKKTNFPLVLVIGIILAIISAYCLALFLGPDRDAGSGAFHGFLIGTLIVAASIGSSYLFDRKPISLILINSAFWAILFTVMGTILGVWK